MIEVTRGASAYRVDDIPAQAVFVRRLRAGKIHWARLVSDGPIRREIIAEAKDQAKAAG